MKIGKAIFYILGLLLVNLSSYGQDLRDVVDEINVILNQAESNTNFQITNYRKFKKTGLLTLKKDGLKFSLQAAKTRYTYVEIDSTLKRVRMRKPSIYKKYKTKYPHWIRLTLKDFPKVGFKYSAIHPNNRTYVVNDGDKDFKFKTKEEALEFKKLIDLLISKGTRNINNDPK